MQLDVQWFVSALLDNEMITLEEAVNLDNELGSNAPLQTYAQTLLERMAANMSEEDANNLVGMIQQVYDFAAEQAATGVVPDIFIQEVEPEPAPEPAPEPKRPKTVAKKIAAGKLPGSFSKDGIAATADVAGNGFPCFDIMTNLNDQQLGEMMKSLLLQLNDYGASDLHISANSRPFVRRNLNIERISDVLITPEYAERLNTVLLTEEQKKKFKEELEMNFALEFRKSRFRASLMHQKDGVSGSYRIVPEEIRTLEELGFLPKDVDTIKRLVDFPNGLLLVTGPIGSGKTTTLAALVDIANRKREDHIITVEDPIEILQESKKCQVTQRQVGIHTNSYSRALRASLREDPDIIIIGEMFDLETIENAITAAETGHLVIGTLHTCDAANTMNRLLDVFPPNQQSQIRAMTAGSLRGIICQRLVPSSDGNLTIAYEILVNNMAVASIIADGKTFQLKGTMQIGQKSGMCTLENTLLEKYKIGTITYETALANMADPIVIQLLNTEMAKREAQKLSAAAQARQH
ncbi:MAG: Twitching mobility protein [Lentisphaerae bacterium ADurb.Bin242]|nr:MAG: Twitching mobility protein [Lentisphaerae bacterium ADurb.Bin242]